MFFYKKQKLIQLIQLQEKVLLNNYTFQHFLIYKNDFKVSKKIFYKKNKFKGKIGVFEINKNTITHQLNFYSIENNKFKKIF